MARQADVEAGGGTVKDQARNLAEEARKQTAKATGQMGDHVKGLLVRQKDETADRLGSLAGALREAGRKLGEDELSGDLSRYTDRAAEQVDRISDYLRQNDLSSFVSDTESFARRRPEVFLGGALLAGLALARFLKASSPSRGQRSYDGSDQPSRSAVSARRAASRSSHTPPRRNPDEAPVASSGTTPYNAPLGV